jgi:hypothetical protein
VRSDRLALYCFVQHCRHLATLKVKD